MEKNKSKYPFDCGVCGKTLKHKEQKRYHFADENRCFKTKINSTEEQTKELINSQMNIQSAKNANDAYEKLIEDFKQDFEDKKLINELDKNLKKNCTISDLLKEIPELLHGGAFIQVDSVNKKIYYIPKNKHNHLLIDKIIDSSYAECISFN
jgi:vacuolar-type H+-ATPase subunit E/Vma4